MTAVELFRALLPKKSRRGIDETTLTYNNQLRQNLLDEILYLPTNLNPLPDTPMTASILTNRNYTEKKPSSTSMPAEYFVQWCGMTQTYDPNYTRVDLVKKDPLKLDEKPLKKILTKKYPWVLDVTEVRIKHKGDNRYIDETAIYMGPLEIHITVSPTHHTELMNPKVEEKVRHKLHEILLPLITCMYENNNKEKPTIIFSPEYSETILENIT